jgi:hypothetical protein
MVAEKYSRLGTRYAKLKAIHDALEFYGMLDSKAGVPAEGSPAMPAMSYAKELMAEEAKTTAAESGGV